MFGPGIYSTSISSKADDYAGATLTGTNLFKIMILNHVALGKSKTMYDALHEMQHAPPMYNSVRFLVLFQVAFLVDSLIGDCCNFSRRRKGQLPRGRRLS